MIFIILTFDVLNNKNVAPNFDFFYVVLHITNVASNFYLFYVVLNITNNAFYFYFIYVVLNITSVFTDVAPRNCSQSVMCTIYALGKGIMYASIRVIILDVASYEYGTRSINTLTISKRLKRNASEVL